ncbi:hypothetical protein BST81_14185 [Leptolyngbya sp. 'hensonii']|uniref:hypothetical protein n=1 Tax=Leptolyngbya sp. 'hensonii' TaxID=1922337 RepID=UPI00094FFC12|nr:hypothetical protein [Leptolyngbya sp. 'hensonii']OLP18161.1 hypothetical protein BST81_14185 [Leptolyngbya sp. 'hensonii']
MITWVIFGLFCPAALGILLGQVIWEHELSHQLLAPGLVLFCIDQARMAVIDLEQITVAKQHLQDPRLDQFYWITVSTIVIELGGFYLASFFLGWGSLVVLLSQIWFNTLATIHLLPAPAIDIQPRSFQSRLPVLIANGVGVILISLWIMAMGQLWIDSILWGMTFAYGIVKYCLISTRD